MIHSGQATDCLVIGGGVIGLSVAWQLAKRGRTVRLLESARIGQAASWAGAGILPPPASQGTEDAYELLRARSHQLHPQWAEELTEKTGIDTGFQRCGGVYVARSRAESATLLANRMWWTEHGIRHEKWNSDQFRQHEPFLASAQPALHSVWFLPDECQLRNPWHLKALESACRQLGVDIVENCPVREVVLLGETAKLAQTDAGDFAADQICLCGGAWTRLLLERLGVSSGILPIRGQMVLYRCERKLISSVVNEGHRYLVPRSEGLLLAGSIEEEAGYVNETTQAGLAQIRNWAEDLLPQLRQCVVEKTWAGLRPSVYDGFPYLGQVPGLKNLYVAAGHYRSGLHLSCATGEVIANEMTGQPNTLDLHPFRVGRG